MPTEEKEEHVARCLLCGDRCWFDDRIYHRLVGWGSLFLGWLLPLCLIEFLEGARWGDPVGFVGGVTVWLVVVAYLFLKQTVWVCRSCGTFYPAQKVRRAAMVVPEDDTVEEGAE